MTSYLQILFNDLFDVRVTVSQWTFTQPRVAACITEGDHGISIIARCKAIKLQRLLIKSLCNWFVRWQVTYKYFLMISLISSLIREFVSGSAPNRGSPPALQRATTASLSFSTAAQNRGELLPLSNKFTSALCWSNVGMTCGLKLAAQWRADLWSESLALGSEPASKSALTTGTELLKRALAARWRAVRWVGNCN